MAKDRSGNREIKKPKQEKAAPSQRTRSPAKPDSPRHKHQARQRQSAVVVTLCGVGNR
jgi:hypothetical protein